MKAKEKALKSKLLRGILLDEVRGPNEAHILHLHATTLPDVHEILPRVLDLLDVSTHLVVHESEPIRHIELENTPSLCTFVHVHRFKEPLRNVHAPRRLEAIVQVELPLP